MRSFIAFTKKELLGELRSGRLFILFSLFILIGIMNPAIAKLTPWLIEAFADSLKESGMIITDVSITALDSWMQFYKNMPIVLILFVLLESSIFTREYTSGTLIVSLTNGFNRCKIVLSKSALLLSFWTIGYFLCFGITYLYNDFFWDNSIAKNLFFSVLCWWIFGFFVISLIPLFSSFSSANSSVLIGVGGVILALYVLGLIPKLNKYLPIALTSGNSLIYGANAPEDYVSAILIAAVLSLACLAANILIFKKRQT